MPLPAMSSSAPSPPAAALALWAAAAAPLLAGPCSACSVPHPHEPAYVLEGADLQYKLINFFAGWGPPPLEEVFFATQNLSATTQEELMGSCPGLLVSSFIVLAELRLPVAPHEAADAIAKADSLAMALPLDAYVAELEAWPIQQAFERYSGAAEAAEAAGRAATSPQRVEIVVAHCRESLDWLVDGHMYAPSLERVSLDLFVYEKCGRDTDPDALSKPFRQVQIVKVDDGGLRCDECSAYLRHLLDRYEDPADYTLFFQADAGDHLQWGYLSLVMKILEQRAMTAGFVHLDHSRLVSSLSPCREEVFRRIFGRSPTSMLGSYCCAQFAVARSRILANPLDRYRQMMSMLQEESPPECHDIPGHSTHCLMFEVYWHVLFGEPDDLPDRAENPQLPLALRTRDMESESYLPRGSLFLDMVLDI